MEWRVGEAKHKGNRIWWEEQNCQKGGNRFSLTLQQRLEEANSSDLKNNLEILQCVLLEYIPLYCYPVKTCLNQLVAFVPCWCCPVSGKTDWSIQRCPDVLKWNKTELAVWNLLSIGVTAPLLPSAAWKQQSLHGKFPHVTGRYLYLSHLLSFIIFLY